MTRFKINYNPLPIKGLQKFLRSARNSQNSSCYMLQIQHLARQNKTIILAGLGRQRNSDSIIISCEF